MLFTPRDSVLGRYKGEGEELRGVWQVEETAGFIFMHSMCLFSSPVRNWMPSWLENTPPICICFTITGLKRRRTRCWFYSCWYISTLSITALIELKSSVFLALMGLVHSYTAEASTLLSPPPPPPPSAIPAPPVCSSSVLQNLCPKQLPSACG